MTFRFDHLCSSNIHMHGYDRPKSNDSDRMLPLGVALYFATVNTGFFWPTVRGFHKKNCKPKREK